MPMTPLRRAALASLLIGAPLLAACDDQPLAPGPETVSSSGPLATSSPSTPPEPPSSSAAPTRPASASTAAASASAPPRADGTDAKHRYAQLSDADVTQLVKPHLKKGETIAHPPHQGPFGPSQSTVVVITKQDNEDFGGFLLVTRGERTERLELPTLQESWPGISVEAIGFVAECDGDSVEELVVISQHRSAKHAATVVSVVDFDGSTLGRLRDVEALAVHAKTVGEVRAALATRTLVVRIDNVPLRIMHTLRPAEVRTRLERLMGVAPRLDSATELVFDYAETDKKGGPTAAFAFRFNDAKVLERITITAASEAGDAKAHNPTARKLVDWLEKEIGAGKPETGKPEAGEPDATHTRWDHNGWKIILSSTPNGSHHALTLEPHR